MLRIAVFFLSLTTLLAVSDVSAEDEGSGYQRVHGGPEVERGIHLDLVEDGGTIAVGSTRSYGAGAEDIYLVRTDAEGDALWAHTFGGEDEDFGWSVVETSDGFAVAGFTQSFGKGENDFYLLKISADGDEEWSKTFGGEGNDRCWSLIQTGDGGFLLAGETTSTGAGEEDVWLLKTDPEGTMLWSRSYGGAQSDRCFSVVEADDGGYVLAGQTYSEGAGDRDAYVLKTSADGELEWSKTYGGEASDVAHCVVATSDGAFMVTGYTTSFATAGDDPYLIKIDAEGNSPWTRVLPLDGVNHTITGDQAADGGFYLVGFTDFRGRGNTAAVLVKTDPEGRMAWHRNIHFSSVGETFGYTVRSRPDGGCVFVGHAASKNARDLDLLIVEVGGDGDGQ